MSFLCCETNLQKCCLSLSSLSSQVQKVSAQVPQPMAQVSTKRTPVQIILQISMWRVGDPLAVSSMSSMWSNFLMTLAQPPATDQEQSCKMSNAENQLLPKFKKVPHFEEFSVILPFFVSEICEILQRLIRSLLLCFRVRS